VVGDRVDHRDGTARLTRGLERLRAQVLLRLDRDDRGDRLGVVREVRAAARADLDDPSAQALERLAAQLALGVALVGGDPGGEAGEERVVDRGGHVQPRVLTAIDIGRRGGR
jgi:hypothetical protein